MWMRRIDDCTMQTDMTRSVAGLPRLGMGCMRLSTAAERDDGRAVAVIHAALDAGIRLLDTADAYARDASEMGHNERLIARALRSWAGDRRSVTVAPGAAPHRSSSTPAPDRPRHAGEVSDPRGRPRSAYWRSGPSPA
jgi:aryl-alcohol dehydrogenase-like predicted oxidoreductase